MAKFTDRYIKNLTAQTGRYDVTEGDGFTLRVYPTGKKSWRYVYRQDGKLHRLTIGSYPEMPLAEARQVYQEMHTRRKRGLPPVEIPDEPPPVITFKVVGDAYLRAVKGKLAATTFAETLRILERDLYSKWGTVEAASIKRGAISEWLETFEKPAAANNAFKALRKVFKWAVASGRWDLDYSPCYGLTQPTPDTRGERFLTAEEIRAFWYVLDETRMAWSTRQALRFILVTGQRKGEVCGLPLSEIKGEWWSLPKDRAKNRVANRIYLTALARELLLLDFEREWAFPRIQKEGEPETPIRGNILDFALRRLQDRNTKRDRHLWPYPPFSPHDLRRTCATHLAKLGFANEVIDAVLNHVLPGVRGIYNRYRYDKEKEAAMRAWEEKLRGIIAKGPPDYLAALSAGNQSGETDLDGEIVARPRKKSKPKG